jgi:DEAD/DEAH box helicase domain-containing protein
VIPSVVARQVRETVLDYLRTTFALSDPDFERCLFDFLDGDTGLFRGPFLDIRLPFRTADPGEHLPLEIRPGFNPYQHQLRSFQRLYSKDGHQPQHTLVTTGTGSGKTECFLYPILDHCWRERDRRGIKAILLYPMNALATDQARRLARTLWDDERLRGQVTAGLYVGGQGQHGVADRDHLVDKRDVLRDSPPDILLTNYKMLDFLLLRPEDRRLWEHNESDTLRYLVLDELHTYDGAQGSDVACLIRRLKSRLEVDAGSLCCVGTSATVGGGARQGTIRALTDFASTVFDETIFEDAVILEDRQGIGETLGDEQDLERWPEVTDIDELDPDAFDEPRLWMQKQVDLWLGEGCLAADRVGIGRLLQRHVLLRRLLRALGGQLRSTDHISEWLLEHEPRWSDYDEQTRSKLLESFVALVSWARRTEPAPEDEDPGEPFLQVQTQFWLRELRHLLQRVSAEPEFTWAADISPDKSEHWLPLAHCRECGANGLGTTLREGEDHFDEDLTAIGRSWLNSQRSCRYLTFGAADDGTFPSFICPKCLRVSSGQDCRCSSEGKSGVPIRISSDASDAKVPRFLARCPDCGSDHGLSMMGSRAASLLSVAIGHLFQSEHNDDPKLLVFTDSVQDASHRAGFFGARTYRFNLRTAIQGFLEADKGNTTLADLHERLYDHWSAQMEKPRLISTFMPADLRELPRYVNFLERGGSGSHRPLEEDLKRRLSWEMALEFGHNALIGRTLERTRCSTVGLDAEAIERVAERLELEITEGNLLTMAFLEKPTRDQLRHFVQGLLQRQRVRGGVYHEMLTSYLQNAGNRFHLSRQRNRLMSPFGRQSRLPRFLTDRPAQEGREQVFDGFASKPTRPNWHRDWLARSLKANPEHEDINTFLLETLELLCLEGVLIKVKDRRGSHAYGLAPARLTLSRHAAQLQCPECNQRTIVPQDHQAVWEGQSCLRFRCVGVLKAVTHMRSSYYARVYRSSRLRRIFSHEHTGLLSRTVRERLEERFKSGSDPDAPNLLVSTPTLEMGIDVGDLSAVVLNSVAPTTANHLQRIGRAGRRTGNAVCLTMANSRPHDLYFTEQPLEMMAGEVRPPGCFLDAPEMLKRQLVAHAMDAWARADLQTKAIPQRVRLVLGKAGKKNFPGRFLAFYHTAHEDLLRDFLARFDSYLSEDSRTRLSEFAGPVNVEALIVKAFDEVELHRKHLRDLQRRCLERLQQVEADPEASDDPENEITELKNHRSVLSRLMDEEGDKYPLNVLTDAGVLPNYAFPEPGVTLKSVIRDDGDADQRYKSFEYMRPASAAIRELAPFNVFYAEGRKVTIDEIDIGTSARPLVEHWRLCTACSHMEREDPGTAHESTCPRCESIGWGDSGQLRALVHFRRAHSLANAAEAVTVDEQDDREELHYSTMTLIDVEKENYQGARLIEAGDLVFGWELLRDLPLRELNFGLSDGQAAGVEVSGEEVPERGFQVCLDCGRVKRNNDEINHAWSCRARKTGNEERLDALWLYREVRSEAIRILLPVADFEADEKRASFKAALELGFRRRFQGNPGHLQVRYHTEPMNDGSGAKRQFLVVFDAVPGGTGYLSELWHGDNFLEILRLSLQAMRGCVCQQDPDHVRAGCYRCVYAYQDQRNLKLISSQSACEMIERVLEAGNDAREVDTLSDVPLDTLLESELERKFLAALEGKCGEDDHASWQKRVEGGEAQWILRLANQAWRLRAQRDLGYAQGVTVMSRPDFTLEPLDGDPAVRPVAVFCDGFAYHVQPEAELSRLSDDIHKRRSIIASGHWLKWSVTWRDVREFCGENTAVKSILEDTEARKLQLLHERVGGPLDRATGTEGSAKLLWAYLENPDAEAWRIQAHLRAVAWAVTGPFLSPGTADATESNLLESVGYPDAPSEQKDPDHGLIARYDGKGVVSLLARMPGADLAVGNVNGVRAVLRLYDDQERRSGEGFEESWRVFLQAWNLLQFLPELEVVDTEGLDVFVTERQHRHETAAATASAATPQAGEPAITIDDLVELTGPTGRLMLEKLVATDTPIKLMPEVGYELHSHQGTTGPEAELAWPAQKIALLAEDQLYDRKAFENAGWSIVADAPIDDMVYQVNSLLGQSQSEGAEDR